MNNNSCKIVKHALKTLYAGKWAWLLSIGTEACDDDNTANEDRRKWIGSGLIS